MKSRQEQSCRGEGRVARVGATGLRPPLRQALAVLLVLACLAPGLALAQGPQVVINGRPLAPSHPVVQRAGALLLPLRDVCAALGAQIQWYPAERKIELRRAGSLVEMWVRTPVAQVNRNPVQLAVPPLLVDGVTYLPLRLAGEALGCAVRWEAATRTVAVTDTPQAGQSPASSRP